MSPFRRLLYPRGADIGKSSLFWVRGKILIMNSFPVSFFLSFPLAAPILIRAFRDLPSTPPLFHNIDRHCFEAISRALASGIHRCLHTLHTATLIVVQPMQPLYSSLS